MEQLTFFQIDRTENGVNVRRTDPPESKLAAWQIKVKAETYRAYFIESLRYLGTATANEVGRHATPNTIEADSIRKRAKELERAGLIRKVGSRACMVTGKTAGVYEVCK